MCDRQKMTFSEVNLLKNKGFNNANVYSPLVKLVSSIFNKAKYTLSRERVAIVSNSFKKPCVLRSFFSKKVLTTNFDSPIKSLIQLNRFQADTIIIEHKYLQAFANHYLTGLTQHKYKKIYVLSDETLDLVLFNSIAASRLAINSNLSRVKLVNEVPCLPLQSETTIEQDDSVLTTSAAPSEPNRILSVVNTDSNHNVEHLNVRYG